MQGEICTGMALQRRKRPLPGGPIGPPLRPEQLTPALRVIEAAQSLAGRTTWPEMLAALARQLTEFLDASACLISLVDAELGRRARSRRVRPPAVAWDRTAEEYTVATTRAPLRC